MRGQDDLFIPTSPPQHGSFAPGIYMPPSTRAIGPADSERSTSSSVLQVYSTPELMANVINELDTVSLLTLRCTSGRLRHLVNRTFYGRLCKLLSLFIPYGHLEEFKNTLNHTESILAGVFVVAVMIWERSWDPSQLDLLIPSTARYVLAALSVRFMFTSVNITAQRGTGFLWRPGSSSNTLSIASIRMATRVQ